jgi:hypothetical protein
MRMNKRSCKLDYTKEEFEGTNGLCKLCKADLTPKTESPNVKVESPEPREAMGGVSEVSDLAYTQHIPRLYRGWP